jgi:hypothetical protein
MLKNQSKQISALSEKNQRKNSELMQKEIEELKDLGDLMKEVHVMF